MGKKKRYSFTYEQWEEEGMDATNMAEEIVNDEQLKELEEIVIGCWGEMWEDSAQAILDGIVENKEKFDCMKSLFVGDVDYEECEVSWIIQGDYSKLWAALPRLEKLTIKGSTDLILGDIVHDNLQELEIICGGLPVDVMKSIQKAQLPSLRRLVLYIGVEDYGFDGSVEDIKELLENMDCPKLEHLGIVDSEIQDEITEAALNCRYIDQIHTLELSMGTLTDKGGQLLLEKIPDHSNIQKLDLHFHYLSEEMMGKLNKLPIEVDTEDRQVPEDFNGEIYYFPMLTE